MQNNIIYEDLTKEQSLISRFMYATYMWMTLGLLLTALCAMYVSGSQTLLSFFYSSRFMLIGVFIVEIGIVIYLSRGLMRMSYQKAYILFLIYSALNGITLASIFMIYSSSSIANAFITTSATFGVMSVYGYVTKADLSKLGNILFMGLIGIIISSLVNLFLRSSGLEKIISYLGVLIFVGLTAYDTQALKKMAMQIGDENTLAKLSIMGALKLYLDFINMFLFILRIMGRSRD